MAVAGGEIGAGRVVRCSPRLPFTVVCPDPERGVSEAERNPHRAHAARRHHRLHDQSWPRASRTARTPTTHGLVARWSGANGIRPSLRRAGSSLLALPPPPTAGRTGSGGATRARHSAPGRHGGVRDFRRKHISAGNAVGKPHRLDRVGEARIVERDPLPTLDGRPRLRRKPHLGQHIPSIPVIGRRGTSGRSFST